MKNLLSLIAILMVLLVSACSSTSTVAIKKKPLVSDHYLMLSLLNRDIPQDQQMMLAFADQRSRYQSPYFVNAVAIKGPKSEHFHDSFTISQTKHSYSHLISQDFNSVQISGPN